MNQSEPQQPTHADCATLLGHFIRGDGLDLDERCATLADAHYSTFGGFFRPTGFLAMRNSRGYITRAGLAYYERHGDLDRNGRARLAHRSSLAPANT
jgi:hypothetical protein